jgi:hypothetical protein
MQGSPHCARPGCGGDVAAWLTYDYQTGTVWLDDPSNDAGGNRWALCSAHADGLRVPVGWARRDRRAREQPASGLSRLFATEGPHAAGADRGPAESAIAV